MQKVLLQPRLRISLSVGLALLSSGYSFGCGASEDEGMDRKGHYVFESTDTGFEIREGGGLLTRLLELVLGRSTEPKMRVGHGLEGPDAFEPESIARVLVRKRIVRAPEIKSPFKRPWAVRFLDREERELAPFFHFRTREEAEAFANDARRRISALVHPGDGSVRPSVPANPR